MNLSREKTAILLSVVVMICFFSFELRAQEKGYAISVMPGISSGHGELPEVPDTVKFYKDYKAEVWAEPKEGWYPFYDRLKEMEYPAEAKRLGQECDLDVSFNLDRNGKISNIRINYMVAMNFSDKGKCQSCEELAKKIIRETEWVPATIHGNSNKHLSRPSVKFRYLGKETMTSSPHACNNPEIFHHFRRDMDQSVA